MWGTSSAGPHYWKGSHQTQQDVSLQAVLRSGAPGTPSLLSCGLSALGWGGEGAEGPGTRMAAESPRLCFQTAQHHPELNFYLPHPTLTRLAGGDRPSVRQVDRSSGGGSSRRAGTGHRSGPRWRGERLSPDLRPPRQWVGLAGLPGQAGEEARPGILVCAWARQGRAEDISGQCDPGRDHPPSPSTPPWAFLPDPPCPSPYQALVPAPQEGKKK